MTSVVRRVTRLELLKRSMVAKSKVWMLANMSRRRFFEKPTEAFEQVMPAAAPKASDTRAMRARMAPSSSREPISAPALTWSMSTAVRYGIMTSNSTSPVTSRGVAMATPLYSPMLFARVLIIQ